MAMKTFTAALAASFLLIQGGLASGPVGVYGIVEKVVFEPSAQAPERVQVWGVFAYVDGAAASSLTVSAARRGYLYFRLSPVVAAETIRKEWADLQAVAGTGQAVAFGRWGYIGAFGGLQPGVSGGPPYILENMGGSSTTTDMRVRPATEAPQKPAAYETNAGVVKLADGGSHAGIVKALREALGK